MGTKFTSEDVQRAIERLQSKYVDDLEDYLASCGKWNRNIDLATAALQAHQSWVSVKDRLPEEGDYVLCVLKGFNYGGKIQVCKFVSADKFKDKPYFEHFRNGFPSVTHWMSLPEPPKGE